MDLSTYRDGTRETRFSSHDFLRLQASFKDEVGEG